MTEFVVATVFLKHFACSIVHWFLPVILHWIVVFVVDPFLMPINSLAMQTLIYIVKCAALILIKFCIWKMCVRVFSTATDASFGPMNQMKNTHSRTFTANPYRKLYKVVPFRMKKKTLFKLPMCNLFIHFQNLIHLKQ